jgi:hypothetical protein
VRESPTARHLKGEWTGAATGGRWQELERSASGGGVEPVLAWCALLGFGLVTETESMCTNSLLVFCCFPCLSPLGHLGDREIWILLRLYVLELMS